MVKLKIFEITFTDNCGNLTDVFYAGSKLQGYVTIELTEAMSMRGIQLNLNGRANVYFTKTSWNKRNYIRIKRGYSDTSDVFKATEEYFDQSLLLYGTLTSAGTTTTELQSGRHTFPFQYPVPSWAPTSFEAQTGHVRYYAKCKIDKPWKFDHNTKKAFTIIRAFDLNYIPLYANPVQRSICKRLDGCHCCQSGAIEATFHLNQKGFVPGEAIKLFAEISNGANSEMDDSYVVLIMEATFTAQSYSMTESKTERKEVAKVSRGPSPIAAHGSDSWTGEEIVIPPLPPSFLKGCNSIDIRYILQLNVVPFGCASKLKVPIEVVIGTVPLKPVQENLSSPPGPGAMALPWPTFNESTTGKADIREESDNQYLRGDTNWAPKYTYYN